MLAVFAEPKTEKKREKIKEARQFAGASWSFFARVDAKH
jgi:hypothetical protein